MPPTMSLLDKLDELRSQLENSELTVAEINPFASRAHTLIYVAEHDYNLHAAAAAYLATRLESGEDSNAHSIDEFFDQFKAAIKTLDSAIDRKNANHDAFDYATSVWNELKKQYITSEQTKNQGLSKQAAALQNEITKIGIALDIAFLERIYIYYSVIGEKTFGTRIGEYEGRTRNWYPKNAPILVASINAVARHSEKAEQVLQQYLQWLQEKTGVDKSPLEIFAATSPRAYQRSLNPNEQYTRANQIATCGIDGTCHQATSLLGLSKKRLTDTRRTLHFLPEDIAGAIEQEATTATVGIYADLARLQRVLDTAWAKLALATPWTETELQLYTGSLLQLAESVGLSKNTVSDMLYGIRQPATKHPINLDIETLHLVPSVTRPLRPSGELQLIRRYDNRGNPTDRLVFVMWLGQDRVKTLEFKPRGLTVVDPDRPTIRTRWRITADGVTLRDADGNPVPYAADAQSNGRSLEDRLRVAWTNGRQPRLNIGLQPVVTNTEPNVPKGTEVYRFGVVYGPATEKMFDALLSKAAEYPASNFLAHHQVQAALITNRPAIRSLLELVQTLQTALIASEVPGVVAPAPLGRIISILPSHSRIGRSFFRAELAQFDTISSQPLAASHAPHQALYADIRRLLRPSMGISENALSEQLGVDQSTMKPWLQGKVLISHRILLRIIRSGVIQELFKQHNLGVSETEKFLRNVLSDQSAVLPSGSNIAPNNAQAGFFVPGLIFGSSTDAGTQASNFTNLGNPITVVNGWPFVGGAETPSEKLPAGVQVPDGTPLVAPESRPTSREGNLDIPEGEGSNQNGGGTWQSRVYPELPGWEQTLELFPTPGLLVPGFDLDSAPELSHTSGGVPRVDIDPKDLILGQPVGDPLGELKEALKRAEEQEKIAQWNTPLQELYFGSEKPGFQVGRPEDNPGSIGEPKQQPAAEPVPVLASAGVQVNALLEQLASLPESEQTGYLRTVAAELYRAGSESLSLEAQGLKQILGNEAGLSAFLHTAPPPTRQALLRALASDGHSILLEWNNTSNIAFKVSGWGHQPIQAVAADFYQAVTNIEQERLRAELAQRLNHSNHTPSGTPASITPQPLLPTPALLPSDKPTIAATPTPTHPGAPNSQPSSQSVVPAVPGEANTGYLSTLPLAELHQVPQWWRDAADSLPGPVGDMAHWLGRRGVATLRETNAKTEEDLAALRGEVQDPETREQLRQIREVAPDVATFMMTIFKMLNSSPLGALRTVAWEALPQLIRVVHQRFFPPAPQDVPMIPLPLSLHTVPGPIEPASPLSSKSLLADMQLAADRTVLPPTVESPSLVEDSDVRLVQSPSADMRVA